MFNDLLAVIALIIAYMGLFIWREEIKKWNKGTCHKNGLPWKLIDRDSQGGRLYRAGDETIWISWPMVDSE